MKNNDRQRGRVISSRLHECILGPAAANAKGLGSVCAYDTTPGVPPNSAITSIPTKKLARAVFPYPSVLPLPHTLLTTLGLGRWI